MRQTETYDQETKGIENRQLCLSIIQQQESLTKINQVLFISDSFTLLKTE